MTSVTDPVTIITSDLKIIKKAESVFNSSPSVDLEPIESIREQVAILLDNVKSIDLKLVDVSDELVKYINNKLLVEKGNCRVIQEVVCQLLDRVDEDYYDFYGELIRYVTTNIDSEMPCKGEGEMEDLKGDELFKELLIDKLEKKFESGMDLDSVLSSEEFCNEENGSECNPEELMRNRKFMYLLNKEKNYYIGLIYMMCESLKQNISNGIFVLAATFKLFNDVKESLDGVHRDDDEMGVWRHDFKRSVLIDTNLECICLIMYEVGKILCTDERYNPVMEHFFIELFLLNKWNDDLNAEIKEIINDMLECHNNNWETRQKVRMKLMRSKRARIVSFRGFRKSKYQLGANNAS